MVERTVSDIMTRNPITAKPNESLLSCAKKMIKKRIGSLVLVEKGKLKGIVSQKDILWAIVKKSDLSKVKAKDVSPKKLITLKPSAKISEAISKINKNHFYRLPVVKEGKLMGLLTLKDILSMHPEVYSNLKEIEFIREEEEKIKRLKDTDSYVKVSVRDGICNECGQRAPLYKSNGTLVCASCLDSI
ncbi:CBS domain-containing protein [Patescibacteria group bacterium]|nr:CBS domain-containing protein [Patescibacteria group bacterium]